MDNVTTPLGVIAVFAGLVLALLTLLFARRAMRLDLSGARFDMEQDWPELGSVLEQLGSLDAPAEDKQLALFIRYHDETRNHARLISTFSLLFAGFGFCVIVFAFVTAQPSTALTEQGRALLTAFSGVVIESVSALFFVQSNKARAALAEFLDRLREDRKLDKALNLAETVNDSTLKSRLQVMISLSFIGRPVTDELLTSLFGIDQQADNERATGLTSAVTN